MGKYGKTLELRLRGPVTTREEIYKQMYAVNPNGPKPQILNILPETIEAIRRSRETITICATPAHGKTTALERARVRRPKHMMGVLIASTMASVTNQSMFGTK